MSEPKIAGLKSIPVELEEGQIYMYCTCGYSESQPFCDGSHMMNSPLEPLMFTAHKTGTAKLCSCKHTATPPYCDGAHKALCTDES